MIGAGAAGAFASWWITDTIDSAALNRIKLADARAKEAAVATKDALGVDLSAIGIKVSGEFETAREHTYYVTRTILREVPAHVGAQTDSRFPLAWGLVRVHDAAILGVDPAQLSLPAGQSDDTAAPVKASDLAANDAENFGACRANAEQLARVLEWARTIESTWNAYAANAKGETP
jgi:hypothetical protein